MVTKAPTISKSKPAFTISLTFTFPVLYAIAFGGVPTGNIKSRLEHTATKTAETTGLIPIARLTDMAMGTKTLALAVLLATIVKSNAEKPKTKNKMADEPLPTATAKLWPTQSVSPDASIAAPKLKPPPKSRTVFQCLS